MSNLKVYLVMLPDNLPERYYLVNLPGAAPGIYYLKNITWSRLPGEILR